MLDLRELKIKSEIFDFFFQDIYSLSSPFPIKDMNIFVDRLKRSYRKCGNTHTKYICLNLHSMTNFLKYNEKGLHFHANLLTFLNAYIIL